MRETKGKGSGLSWLVLAVAAALGAVAPAVSCNSVETAFDCQDVCSRYRDCYDANYDVGACRDRCRENAEDSAAKRAKADACESCIGDKSCLSATFSCAGDCSSILP